MSRLTASPFHKPAPFEFPRVPLSPPETNAEIIGPSRMASSGSLLGPNDHRHGDIEPSPALSTPTPESAGAHNGVTMTPRVSDEFWPYIWSHVFDANATVRPPISGKIEFDIDIRQARWYTSWMASSHRDYVDHPFSANPSVAPSVTHHERGESKTTFQDVDDEEPRFAAPVTRHVPRKLSLVDRYDMMSVRSGTRHGSRSALSPPEQVHPSSQVLSPIFQEEEPKSAKHDLDSRVKSWRASAVLKPTPLAATGQTSLEPVNMPNTLPIEDDLLATPDEELNLADFAWSVSSEGPNDYDPMSPMSWDHVPSVHIAHRMEGSVCLTPTTYTSFGPSDYTLSSPGSSIYRLPSPDVARRMYEDVPPTPSTVTSWGPVASLPSSPLYSEYRSRSVHLGDRGDYSRPVTPSTATSWGAPLSYPPSPSTPFYMNTPDAGHRGFEDSEMFVRHMPWGHSWPYKMKSSISRSGDLQCPVTDGAIVPSRHSQQAIPWVLSWPAWSVGAQQYGTVHSSQSHQLTPWAFSWPARSVDARTRSLVLPSSLNPPREQTSPWAYSWPYRGISRSVDAQALPPPQQVVSPWAHSWPYQGVPPSPNALTHTPWEHLWPYIGTSQSVDVQAPQKAVSPWVHSWPYQGISRPGGVKTRSPWAHSWPYSVQSGEVDVLVSSATQETCSLGSLQQGTVPWSLLWPYRSLKEDSGPIFTHLPLAYPRLVLCTPSTTVIEF
ncbi:hypothetical protein H0H81_008972 [Sphagnurus paluster]|uniref:Uncharacterized protein n=1 Tax=Sphagnurus paluster TaxID=117069 RepID=A0A9P7GPZ5_9AGAR|nr:hypothetical protein H0H81_008972 [Sphagnurus paluster]